MNMPPLRGSNEIILLVPTTYVMGYWYAAPAGAGCYMISENE